MKKKTAIYINCFVLVLAFVFMFCFCVIFPRTTESDNSILKEFPKFSAETFFSGEYFSDLSAWFTDTVFMRDKFVDINASFRGLFGFTPEEEIFNNGPQNGNPDAEIPEEEWDPEEEWNPEDEWETTPPKEDVTAGGDVPPQEDTLAPGETEEAIEDPETKPQETIPVIEQVEKPVEVVNDILIIGTRALEIYYGNAKNAALFGQVLNDFSDKVGSDVNVYSMVIPKACAYYISESKNYSKYAGNSLRDITALQESLVNVKHVPIYGVLEAHKDEEIYYRTDHHWTGLGAYYAAETFAQVAGVDFAPLSSYKEEVRKGYIGTMYKYTDHSPTLLNNPENFVTYVPSAPYVATFYNQQLENGREHDIYWYIKDESRSSWYSTYIAGDAYSVVIKSQACNNGRKLLIVKDSYGNALAPYFLNSFEEIYIVDARVFKLSLPALVKEKGITDVLFAECAFSMVGSYRKNVEALTK